MATPSTPITDRRPESFFSPPNTSNKTEKKVSPEPVTVRKKDYSGYYYYKVFEKKGEEEIDEEICRDWNAEFQEIVDGLGNTREENERVEKYKQLSQLAEDFDYVAKTYGKIIILERFSKHKTIRPVAVGGIAGGDKYVAQGILFKFATDRHGLYGGDHYSAKAAANELILQMPDPGYSCAAYEVEKLNDSSISLIDYRGFRLIAMSICPILDLVYGSNDGGVTVHADDPILCDKMASAAKKLNIKGHWVGMHQEKKYIYGPTDLEGHQGKDNRYYLLDFSRVFPPEYPQAELPKRSVLYNLLRPEFVASYPKPLSSDALSGFGKHDAETHNSETQEATQFLIEKIIPAFAGSLSTLSAKQSNIVELFHREGINIRQMGLVRHYASSAEWKKYLLIEMVARVIKDDIKETLRTTVSKLKVPSEKPCKEAIAFYFNFLLGKHGETISFWKGEIKTKIVNKFRNEALTEDEKRNDYLLNFGIDISALFSRIQVLSGVRLSPKALQNLKQNSETFTCIYPDIQQFVAEVKDMNITAHAEGMALYIQSMQTKGNEGDRLFNLAMNRFEAASSSTLDNRFTVKSWADALQQQAQRKKGEERDKLFTQASEKYSSIDNYPALISLSKSIVEQAKKETGVERYRMLQLANSNFQNAAKICQKFDSKKDSCEVHFCWGESILATAELSTNFVGDKYLTLLEEAGRCFEKAIFWSPDSHPILYPLFAEAKKSGNLTFAELAALVSIYKSCLHFSVIDSSSSKYITDNLIAHIAKFHPSIQVLRIHHTKGDFSGSIFSTAPLTSIHTVDFQQMSFTGEQTTNFETLTNSGTITTISPSLISKLCTWCPNLVTLNLKGCVSLPEVKFTEIMVGLKNIDVSDCKLLRDKSLISIGKCCPNLEILSVAGCGSLTDDGLIFVVQNCIKLDNLNLSHCKKVTNNSLFQIALKLGQNMKSLKLIGLVEITNPGVIAVIKEAKQMTCLKLGNCINLTDEVLVEVANNCPQLLELDLIKCKQISNLGIMKIAEKCVHLTTLRLNECLKITDAAISHLALRCPKLECLELGGLYKITQESIHSLAKYCPLLTNLNLSECDQVSNDALATVAANCTNLSSLNLYNSKIQDETLLKMMKQCSSLTKLNLSACKNLTCSSVDLLAKHCFLLQSLSLEFAGKFSQISLETIAKNCGQTLKKIDLSECKHVTDEFLISLVSNCTNIEELWLNSCSKLSDSSIIKCSQYCSLKVLKLSGCFKLTDPCIINVAKYSPQLLVLCLGRAYRITDAAIAKVAQNCRLIQVLQLNGCKQITDASIVQLAQNCRFLQKLQLDSCHLITKEALLEVRKGCPLAEISNKF